MRHLMFVFLLLAGSCVPSNLSRAARDSKEIASFINSLNTTWKASPAGYDAGNLLNLVRQRNLSRNQILRTQVIPDDFVFPPPEFDGRKQWSYCKSLLEIRDQSNCGSCWAQATVEAITDRICISTDGKFQADISAQDLMTCCTECGKGCQGGEPFLAWKHYVEQGLVTGGLYNGSGCRPYSIPPGHHGEEYIETPVCNQSCVNGADYKADKHYGVKAYNLPTAVYTQLDIMKYGPVVAEFTVYADFPNYKSGIYQRHSDVEVGAHDVKLIGWGVEEGVNYWLAANSWNETWGENGFFRIRRGVNECKIEDQISAGIPDNKVRD